MERSWLGQESPRFLTTESARTFQTRASRRHVETIDIATLDKVHSRFLTNVWRSRPARRDSIAEATYRYKCCLKLQSHYKILSDLLRVARSKFTGNFGHCSLIATTPPNLSRGWVRLKSEQIKRVNSPPTLVMVEAFGHDERWGNPRELRSSLSVVIPPTQGRW